ncbi:hypothetical protein Hypma_003411 [Hypsizygus marmoreus]|uniref:Uncharacterized protein n=1 Tax=Hypsizygus marmoreus TaxID=39966 RepID=A0A369JB46_HYPMA|nr:hypothetical protein Hypma_003411 [Hypsizygus marmoreus]
MLKNTPPQRSEYANRPEDTPSLPASSFRDPNLIAASYKRLLSGNINMTQSWPIRPIGSVRQKVRSMIQGKSYHHQATSENTRSWAGSSVGTKQCVHRKFAPNELPSKAAIMQATTMVSALGSDRENLVVASDFEKLPCPRTLFQQIVALRRKSGYNWVLCYRSDLIMTMESSKRYSKHMGRHPKLKALAVGGTTNFSYTCASHQRFRKRRSTSDHAPYPPNTGQNDHSNESGLPTDETTYARTYPTGRPLNLKPDQPEQTYIISTPDHHRIYPTTQRTPRPNVCDPSAPIAPNFPTRIANRVKPVATLPSEEFRIVRRIPVDPLLALYPCLPFKCETILPWKRGNTKLIRMLA